MTHELWSTLNDKMFEYLESVKLSDLVVRQRAADAKAASEKTITVIQDKRLSGSATMTAAAVPEASEPVAAVGGAR